MGASPPFWPKTYCAVLLLLLELKGLVRWPVATRAPKLGRAVVEGRRKEETRRQPQRAKAIAQRRVSLLEIMVESDVCDVVLVVLVV